MFELLEITTYGRPNMSLSPASGTSLCLLAIHPHETIHTHGRRYLPTLTPASMHEHARTHYTLRARKQAQAKDAHEHTHTHAEGNTHICTSSPTHNTRPHPRARTLNTSTCTHGRTYSERAPTHTRPPTHPNTLTPARTHPHTERERAPLIT